MLSIIICSVNPEYAAAMTQNIAQTVGVPYELLLIDNQGTGKGICQVYNEGAALAQYPILCFLHEDLHFQTPNWGALLAHHFATLPNPGVIGIAGAVYKPKALSSWWQEATDGFEPRRCRLVQHLKFRKHPPNYTYFNPDNEISAEVIALDGLFLSMQKSTWDLVPFDQDMLKGFHGYDLDISLSVSCIRKNYAVLDILVDHLSEGKNDETWLLDNFKVHAKHAARLPLVVEKYHDAALNLEAINSYWHYYWLAEMISWQLPKERIEAYFARIVTYSNYTLPPEEVRKIVSQAFQNYKRQQRMEARKARKQKIRAALKRLFTKTFR